MDITCNRCGAPIQAADVNLDNRLAKCRACNAVFDFTAQVPSSGGSPPRHRRPAVPMPEGMRIVEDTSAETEPADYRDAPRRTGRLVITRSWYSTQLYFLVFFCIAWDSFLVFWYKNALGASGAFSLLFTLFPIVHVAVGVGLTYRTLAGFMNKTRITATPEALSVRHGPLPWRGNRTIPAAELDQLYCEEVVTRDSDGGRSTSTYNLSAVLKDGKKLQLLQGLPSADQALFIEQQVEERLGIVDAPVGGEYQGK